MRITDVQKALQNKEYNCRRCDYTWFSFHAKRPMRCPVCPSHSIDKVTGESMRTKMYWNRIDSVLKILTYREREIIRLRYGADDSTYIYTQTEVGKIFTLTRQRIQQVEAKALRKLQHPVRKAKLQKLGLLGWYARRTMPSGMVRLLGRITQGT